MVCLRSQPVNTPAGRYAVALFANVHGGNIDYEVSVQDPRRRWTVLARCVGSRSGDRAHELYASAVWALTPAR